MNTIPEAAAAAAPATFSAALFASSAIEKKGKNKTISRWGIRRHKFMKIFVI